MVNSDYLLFDRYRIMPEGLWPILIMIAAVIVYAIAKVIRMCARARNNGRIRQINTVLHCAQQHWNAVAPTLHPEQPGNLLRIRRTAPKTRPHLAVFPRMSVLRPADTLGNCSCVARPPASLQSCRSRSRPQPGEGSDTICFSILPP